MLPLDALVAVLVVEEEDDAKQNGKTGGLVFMGLSTTLTSSMVLGVAYGEKGFLDVTMRPSMVRKVGDPLGEANISSSLSSYTCGAGRPPPPVSRLRP